MPSSPGAIYLNRPERAVIIRWAHSQLEALRNAAVVAPVELAFWETLLLKLEGHRRQPRDPSWWDMVRRETLSRT